jgi:hypothetical protein
MIIINLMQTLKQPALISGFSFKNKTLKNYNNYKSKENPKSLLPVFTGSKTFILRSLFN